MNSTFLAGYGLAVLACLGPLALYICWLASINRRSKPVIVLAAWDFVFLMAGLSGFIVLGGVLLLSLVDSSTRYLYRGSFEELQKGWDLYGRSWLLIGTGYLLLVAGTASMTLYRRSRTLSVYNVDLGTVERAVEAAMEAAGMTPSRLGNGWADRAVTLIPHRSACHALISVNIADAAHAEEVERHLWSALAQCPIPAENGAASWLSTAAVAAVFLVVGIVALSAYIIYFR